MLKKLFLILIGLIGFTTMSWAVNWYTNTANQTNVWLYRQKITVNHANASGESTDFPMLVKITGAANPLFGKAQATGNDILFTRADGSTKITHEVEYYNSSTATLCAWVRMPNVSSTVDVVAYMYYGSSNAAAQGNANGTWDPNFIMVHHLAETSGHHLDETVNANNSTSESLTAQGTQVGTIDGADTFNGTSNYVLTTTTNAAIAAGSICVLADEIANHGATASYMLSANVGGSANRLYLFDKNGTLEAAFSANNNIGVGFTIPATTWHYYALTWSGANYIVYVDGVSKITGSSALTAFPTSFCIGALLPGTAQWFNGLIDEIRASKVQRSASWLLTEWKNMSSPATFITLAAEEKRPSAFMTNAVPAPPDQRRRQYVKRFGENAYD